MNRFQQYRPLLFTLVFVVLQSCGKNNTPPGTPGNGGFNILYPTVMTVNDGSNAPYVYKYSYDANNLLIRYGTDSVIRDIGVHGVNLTTYSYPYMFVTGYAYKLAYQLDTSASIYTGTPSQVSIDFLSKNRQFGTSTSMYQGDYFREYAGNLLIKEITSNGGGQNVNYTYDDEKNLKTIEWVNLTGPRTLAPFQRLTVVGLDDKPSPFVAVQGYRVASWPQGGGVDYGFAFCNNNPTQIKIEIYDATKNQMVLNEQNDFAYTYNANGYPTKIVESQTYYNATTTHYTKTFSFTYK